MERGEKNVTQFRIFFIHIPFPTTKEHEHLFQFKNRLIGSTGDESRSTIIYT
jgi:hypothetical protein